MGERIWLTLPTFNEVGNIERVVRSVLEQLEHLAPDDHRVRIRDLTGGFRCIRREVLEQVELTTLRSQGYVFNIEFAFRALGAGFRVVEVPIHFHDRTIGESKISLGIAVEALWLVPVLRFP